MWHVLSGAVWCALACACVGSRVLVVFPVPSPSHAALGDSVVRALVNAGHQVTYIAPTSSLSHNDNLNKVNVSSLMDLPPGMAKPSIYEIARNPRPPHDVLNIATVFARRLLQHEAVQQLLQDPESTFDLVVAEWFYSGLLAPLALVYNCPLIWYSTVDASWLNLHLMDSHTNPAFSVEPHAAGWSLGQGLRDRLERLLSRVQFTAWYYYTTYNVEGSIYKEAYLRALVLKDRPLLDYESLVYNASLMLVNSHPLVGQTLALPSNAKYVGGHHLTMKPLSKIMQQLLDESENGVILFSMGTMIHATDLSEHTKRLLLRIFGELKQTVIWKLEEPLQGVPKNVHIVKWVSQTSVLNHKNTVLFITHGGLLSVMEATYFGVPIVGVPVFGDQFINVDLAAARGRGVRVALDDNMPYVLYQAIQIVLGNDRYQNRSRAASAIFQDQLTSPQDELVYWIQVVLRHGARHLASPAVQLSVFQQLYLDAVALVIMFLWFCTKVAKVVKVHWNSSDEVVDSNKKSQ